MTTRLNFLVLLALALPLIASVGCNTGTPTTAREETSLAASAFLLDARPEGAVSLTQAAEQLAVPDSDPAAHSDSGPADSPTAPPPASVPVVLVGRIDAGEFPAFQDNQATFMLSELPAEGHGADDPDHADNCPFCKRRAAKAPKAIVNLVDGEGKIVSTDARQLLGLAQGDKIVAVGTASYDPVINMITVHSTGIHRFAAP